MPTTIQAGSVADALIASLNELDRLHFTDNSSDYQSTVALKKIFPKKKIPLESGNEINFNVMTDVSDSARHVGLAYVANSNIGNYLIVGKMPWRHTTWNWALERRLVAMNRGRAKIIDLAQVQRIAALGGAIKLFERTLWRVPAATGETDSFDTDPVGIPYFVVKTSTAFTDGVSGNYGFNGLVPSGYTLVGNINPTTYPRWANYAEPYTLVTPADLIMRMRRGQHYTDFVPLVDETPVHSKNNDYGIYTQYSVLRQLEDVLLGQNDNIGNDLAAKDGKVTFMMTPVTPVRQLDNDTTGVVYMLNWSHIRPVGLSGEWMYEQNFKAEANQPTVSMTNTDCSWNLTCDDRRRQAVFSTGTTMPD